MSLFIKMLRGLPNIIAVIISTASVAGILIWKSNVNNSFLFDRGINDLEPVTICENYTHPERNSLKLQLEAVANQTLLPTTVIVLQNGYYVDISKTISHFRKMHPSTEIQHIASSKNLRYHGRFYKAYMMRETYVSVWDDDIFPKSQWLQYCVDHSKSNGNALVAANGRTFIKIYEKKCSDIEVIGENDFGGHTWTLPREFLKYYLEMEMPTLYTGEDLLLSCGLQQHGIDTLVPKQEGERAAINDYKIFGNDRNSSWRKDQSPRWYLFCNSLKRGFKTIKCENCEDHRVLNACIKYYKKRSAVVDRKAELQDRLDNNKIAWSASKSK